MKENDNKKDKKKQFLKKIINKKIIGFPLLILNKFYTPLDEFNGLKKKKFRSQYISKNVSE